MEDASMTLVTVHVLNDWLKLESPSNISFKYFTVIVFQQLRSWLNAVAP
jgi:hypothetical protein